MYIFTIKFDTVQDWAKALRIIHRNGLCARRIYNKNDNTYVTEFIANRDMAHRIKDKIRVGKWFVTCTK